MAKVRNFHESIEQSLSNLGRHIETGKMAPETKELPERELVKQSLKSFAEELRIESPPEEGERVVLTGPSSSVLPPYLEGDDASEAAKTEVKSLVNVVFEKGLEKALREAGRHGPFVEDAFHDALVDKLLPELKRRGIIS